MSERSASTLLKPTAGAPPRSGFLQRRCACGSQSHGNAECFRCAARRNTLQRKLAIGRSDDPQETEADHIAESVLGNGPDAMQPGLLQVSRPPMSETKGEVPQIVHDVLDSPGRALDDTTRTFMESRFRRDFGDVRVHTGVEARDSARAVDAAAYTVGSHIVFGAAGYLPHTDEGRSLMAHELAHVLQQNAAGPSSAMRAATAPSILQRAPAGAGKKPAAPFTKSVVVDQTTKQNVVATFSDGTTLTDECSTGKGHCCFDSSSGIAEGGVCSASRSNQTDNNCTPVGKFLVTNKIRKTHGGIEFWTQFHDPKLVALHDYDPLVTGSPLSHGCVRLHAATAEKIFNGAVIGKTQVEVRNLARPSCDDSDLQREWRGDFTDAGKKPPDGTMIDPDTNKKYTKEKIRSERTHITETRDDLKSALGVDEKGLDSELAKPFAGSAIQPRIPRCVPAATKEETRIADVKKAGVIGADADTVTAKFTKALKGSANAAAARNVVKTFGDELWTRASRAARGGGAGSDDRQAYWTRLMMESALRAWDPRWAHDADVLRRLHAELLKLLEQASRGFASATFTGSSDLKRILVSGFDPFGFANAGDIRQSNLSGAAALALNGETISDGKVSAEIRSVVYPVRFGDFNEGIVENFLGPQLAGARAPNLVMSISQGANRFELEEYAGRRRSAGSYADNLGVPGGGDRTAPVVAPGLGPGPEFIRTSVPDSTLRAMRGALGRKGGAATVEETEVMDLPGGSKAPRVLSQGPNPKKVPKPPVGLAVEGSGGGYLSNEIFYRNSLLRASSGSSVPVIHLHTPTLAPGASDKARNDLIDTIRRILRAALPGI